MYVLRSINPQNGIMREFKLKADEPVIIGRLSLDLVPQYLKTFSKMDESTDLNKRLSDDIQRAAYFITMGDCNIPSQYISRLHCMIFPDENAKIIDLYSRNGTVIAAPGSGLALAPGRKTDLRPNDIISLAKGWAIFQYLKSDEASSQRADREIEEADLPFEPIQPKYPPRIGG
ncbi:FHA domain-containing protein [Thermodesulfobacteriota bacterium]